MAGWLSGAFPLRRADMDNRIRYTNGTSMSLLKAEKRILDEGKLGWFNMLGPGSLRCGVGVLENWTRPVDGGSRSCTRRITETTRGWLFNINDNFEGTTEAHAEQRALHVAAWLRSQAK